MQTVKSCNTYKTTKQKNCITIAILRLVADGGCGAYLGVCEQPDIKPDAKRASLGNFSR